MKLNPTTIAALAEHLENCQLQDKDTPKITDDHPDSLLGELRDIILSVLEA